MRDLRLINQLLLAMILEFTASPGFDFITRFSELIDVPVRDNYLEILKAMGEGYVRRVGFGDDFRLTIHRYVLKDLVIKRNPAKTSNNIRTIFFYNDREDLEYSKTSTKIQIS